MVSRETGEQQHPTNLPFSESLVESFLRGTSLQNFTFGAAALFLNSVLKTSFASFFVSFHNEKTAHKFYLDCLNLNKNAFLFYPPMAKDERVPGFNLEHERYRAETIIKLSQKDKKHICIGTTKSLNDKDIPEDTSSNISTLTLAKGDKKDRDDIVKLLSSWGYVKKDTVFEPREFAWRGDILDIFPLYFKNPIRIAFDFEHVESVATFDATTQLTINNLPKLTISASPLGGGEAVDYISLMMFSGPDYFVKFESSGGLINFIWPGAVREKSLDCIPIHLEHRKVADRISSLKSGIKQRRVFAIGGARARSLLSNDISDLTWINGNISQGFYSDILDVAVISSSDVLNERKQVEKWAPAQNDTELALTKNDLSSLSDGDYMVHKLFGVGIFRGLSLQNSGAGNRESIEIEYSNNARVFVSLEKMDLIHRYVGSVKNPVLSSLGSKKWLSEVRRVRKSVQLVAKELLELYANKNRKRSFRYSHDNDLDGALAASFPFIETPDQKKAIEETLSDMNRDTPVDRLICGDVGFGKTEVALRAIMKSVLSKKQSIFLCPTTILADQHFITCQERLGPLGVSVGLLSRFKTKREQGAILDQLRRGEIDVLVGTHRVLSRDVIIPCLGLLVVDEEHRFGVNHKEKIRTLKQQVDVITLSATPIPRTLQQSLVGIRDVSLIQTPPRSRKPIETTVRYFDWETVHLYIERELHGDGQVYFLHNDIKGLPYFTKKLQESYPQAVVESIHGQMASRELESKILSFFKGGIDILACTTIIESGLDVTNANCIIINDAQNFGLSQLYQIRGRVGRGHNQAHCLLLVPRRPLEQNAHRRLKTIEQFTSLGSGYDISMKDLEIRGAGSLFGYKQSGHISSIGYELYCELLKKEVDAVVGKDETVRFPNIVFSEDALINEFYILNTTQRLGFYNRLSSVEEPEELLTIKRELKDRFGKLPEETKNLVFIAEVRTLFKNSSVSKILINKTNVSFVFDDIKPYKTMDKFFAAVGSFQHKENKGHRFGKSKKDELTLSFSTMGIVASVELVRASSQLFSVNKDR